MGRGDETLRNLFQGFAAGNSFPSGKAFLAFCFSIPASSGCARGAHCEWGKNLGKSHPSWKTLSDGAYMARCVLRGPLLWGQCVPGGDASARCAHQIPPGSRCE